ncbi:transposase [Adhaeretor mobilis]|uniref:Transposase IS200 like protein n=1 Tax=Adhaeretor mobilis TaxID=1930276 RepID=A0A517N262_9BACT|nr:transposase [Adhaeretor mobilis]QDT01223.1 Transposase IS200 like protein [Adhaeretor mobilis]
MGRSHRAARGGLVYHVLNRANARMTIFEKDEDYAAFEQVLEEAVERTGMRLLAYCLMPNHWHLVVWPEQDDDLSRFTGWLTLTHTQRWHAHRHSTGSGHVYQGRFKSFPLEDDEHYLTVCRYVERNALRANLVAHAEAWRWSSLWRWSQGDASQKQLLAKWPVRRSPNWVEHVNQCLSEAELKAIRRSVERGRPYGSAKWSDRTVKQLGLESTLRPRGRPRNKQKGS